MIAIDPPVGFLNLALASKGPSTHDPRVLCPLPRWTGPVAFVGCFAKPCCLPRTPGGSASTTSLSRPAQALHTLRPVDSLDRQKRPLGSGFAGPWACFVAGLRSSQLPNQTACQLPGQPTIARVGLSPTRLSRRSGRTGVSRSKDFSGSRSVHRYAHRWARAKHAAGHLTRKC